MVPIEIITWVLVASETEAKIYAHHTNNNSFKLQQALHHPEGRLKTHELVTDHPGHYAAGNATGAYSPNHSPKDNENTHFALEIVALLEHARTTNQFNKLIIVCLPHFYGLLEKHLGSELKKMLTDHVMKNYLPMSEKELAEKFFPL